MYLYTYLYDVIHVGIGAICPLGHYCPTASERALPCEAGSYADMLGMALCSNCREGYYCVANSSEFDSQRCPTGYYCPNGTEYATQFACPAGTFNALELGTSIDDCQECTGGQYCEGQ